MSRLSKPWILLLGLAGALLAGAPAEAYIHTFCVNVRVTTVDSGAGEDFYPIAGAITMPARWAKMTVTRNGATVLPTTYASSGGCVSFQSPYTSGFRLEMRGEARVPRTDNTNFNNTLQVRWPNDFLAKWIWYINNPGGGAVHVNTNQSRRTNLLALSTFILSRWSDGLVNRTITVKDEGCHGDPTYSCADGGTAFIRQSGNQNKFLVGHELGHVLVHLWLDKHVPTSYAINSGGAHCTTQDTVHALHSKEYQSAALNEGFAQFYSTAAWNFNSQTDGWFHYYKDYYKEGTVQDVNVENGATGGSTRYMETHCSGSDAGRSTELDWQRALWDYLTNSGDAPSHYQILRQLKNAINGGDWSNSNAYHAFAGAVADYDAQYGTSFHSRWLEMATWNGIDH